MSIIIKLKLYRSAIRESYIIIPSLVGKIVIQLSSTSGLRIPKNIMQRTRQPTTSYSIIVDIIQPTLYNIAFVMEFRRHASECFRW